MQKIVEAAAGDADRLTDLFWENLSSDRSYISHGEIWMGVAADTRTLAPEGRARWRRYIEERITDPGSAVFIAERDGAVDGFIVLEITPYEHLRVGSVNDLVVSPSNRSKGLGSRLLEHGMEWLEANGAEEIFLESGVNNHNAHDFFERKGFEAVSHVFMRKRR